MRATVLFFLAGVCALALAGPTPQLNKYGKEYKVADKAFLQKQKDLLRLLKYVFQHNYYKDQAEIAHSYKIEEHLEQYTQQQYVKEFVSYFHEGLLPRGEVFSIFYEQHRQQAVALFHVLYHAKDWDTFYKTACWAREHVNEGMFVYAIHVAVLHRPDTQGFVLPPIYEIYVYFFVNSEVIDKAYEYKMKDSHIYKTGENNKYYVTANYTGRHVDTDLTEDVGLNALYYYNLDYPFWMGGEQYGLHQDRRGELDYVHLDMSEAHNELPHHYALPKGKVGGQAYKLDVYDNPNTEMNDENTYETIVSAGVAADSGYVDDFPFDRTI